MRVKVVGSDLLLFWILLSVLSVWFCFWTILLLRFALIENIMMNAE